MVKRFESTVTRRSLPVASLRASVTSDCMIGGIDFSLCSLRPPLNLRFQLNRRFSTRLASTLPFTDYSLCHRLLCSGLGSGFDLSVSGKRLHLNAKHPEILTNNRSSEKLRHVFDILALKVMIKLVRVGHQGPKTSLLVFTVQNVVQIASHRIRTAIVAGNSQSHAHRVSSKLRDPIGHVGSCGWSHLADIGPLRRVDAVATRCRPDELKQSCRTRRILAGDVVIFRLHYNKIQSDNRRHTSRIERSNDIRRKLLSRSSKHGPQIFTPKFRRVIPNSSRITIYVLLYVTKDVVVESIRTITHH